jgi:putative transposase
LTQIDEVWISDITYVSMRHKFMYLTAVIDGYSRYVLSWRLSNTLDRRFWENAFLLILLGCGSAA